VGTAEQHVDLRGRGLTSVPAGVWGRRELRSLALGRNPSLTLPAEIGDLTTLEALYLDEMELDAVPGWIRRLEGLRVFDLGHNRLASLPAGVERLRALEILSSATTGSPSCPRRCGRCAR
jgi:leucine-rich repeat protein SHOC2